MTPRGFLSKERVEGPRSPGSSRTWAYDPARALLLRALSASLWEYDQTLFWFYVAGIGTLIWLVWTWIRRYVLFRSVGGKAGEASRTRGF